MNLKPQNKLETSFSMASMTDIIFQLLIFFMLTSSFINPAVLPVNLPNAEASSTITAQVRVTIDKNKKYFVNDQLSNEADLEKNIKNALRIVSEPIVVLHVDEKIPVSYMIKVASIANKLHAKVSIATKIQTNK